MEEVGMTESQLSNVRDKTLREQYEPHDLAQEYFEGRVHEFGYQTRQIGDDNRDAEKVLYGSGPDIALLFDGEIVGYVEIKSKRVGNEAWVPRLNLRHWREYVEFSNSVNEPVFVWFALVDEDTGIIHRHGAIEVVDDHVPEGKVTEMPSSSNQLTGGIPSVKGNAVTCLDPDDMRSFQWLNYRLREGDKQQV